MTDLLAVELKRFWSRRLFRVLVILFMLALLVAGVIALFVSDDSDDAVARAQAESRQQIDQCLEFWEGQGQTDLPPEVEDVREFCESQVFVEDPRFPYNEMPGVMEGLAIPFLMLGWLIGASFVGAEWNHRTMTTMLTWEPRRSRLLVSKLIALVAGVFVVTLLVQAFTMLAFLPAGLFVGNMDGMDSSWWRDLVEQSLRTGGLGVLASVFGMSLAMLGRNTAAALGVGFVYLAVVESLIRGFKPQWSEWLVGNNIALVLDPGDVFDVGHGMGAAALLLAAYAGGLFLVALAFFKRRDLA